MFAPFLFLNGKQIYSWVLHLNHFLYLLFFFFYSLFLVSDMKIGKYIF